MTDEEQKAIHQRIFDKAFKGLQSQGFVRSTLRGACQYRGLDGLRCAIGHVLPDDVYEPSMEGNNVGYLLCEEDFRKRFEGSQDPAAKDLLGADEDFLAEMQDAHDESCSAYTMEKYLKSVAADWGLTVPE